MKKSIFILSFISLLLVASCRNVHDEVGEQFVNKEELTVVYLQRDSLPDPPTQANGGDELPPRKDLWQWRP